MDWELARPAYARREADLMMKVYKFFNVETSPEFAQLAADYDPERDDAAIERWEIQQGCFDNRVLSRSAAIKLCLGC